MQLIFANFALFSATALAATTAQFLGGSWPGWENIHTIFCFGDSYSDTGYRSGPNSQPYPQSTLSPTYDASKAFIWDRWIQYLTSTYNTSLITTYSLAISGATVDEAIIAHSASGGPSTAHEVNVDFSTNHRRRSDRPWHVRDTLFAFWIGVNDIDATCSSRKGSLESKWDDLFVSYSNQLRTLHSLGARHFLILNVPAMEAWPERNSSAPYVKRFNERIFSAAQDLLHSHSDSSVWFMDTHALTSEINADPTVTEATKDITITDEQCSPYHGDKGVSGPDYHDPVCKGSYKQYYWRDGLHLMSTVHKAVAGQISEGFKAIGERTEYNSELKRGLRSRRRFLSWN